MATDHRADHSVYVGLCLVTLATIVYYEIALTRIVSITMWCHFAFVAISVAGDSQHYRPPAAVASSLGPGIAT